MELLNNTIQRACQVILSTKVVVVRATPKQAWRLFMNFPLLEEQTDDHHDCSFPLSVITEVARRISFYVISWMAEEVLIIVDCHRRSNAFAIAPGLTCQHLILSPFGSRVSKHRRVVGDISAMLSSGRATATRTISVTIR